MLIHLCVHVCEGSSIWEQNAVPDTEIHLRSLRYTASTKLLNRVTHATLCAGVTVWGRWMSCVTVTTHERGGGWQPTACYCRRWSCLQKQEPRVRSQGLTFESQLDPSICWDVFQPLQSHIDFRSSLYWCRMDPCIYWPINIVQYSPS